MDFENLIGAFVERVGYPSVPAQRADGSYPFCFDGFNTACQEREGGECLVTGTIGPNDGDERHREERLRRLMQVALIRAGQGHGVFTLDRSRNEFVLCHRFECRNIEPAQFEEQIDQFLNELEFWVSQVGREATAPEGMKYPFGLRP